MEYRIKTLLLVATSTLAAGSFLSGCATTDKVSAAQAAAAPAAVAAAPKALGQAATPTMADQPGAAEGELIVVTAKVKAVDAKSRVVTLTFPDGKEAKVKCGPEVRNFEQIHVGDDVTAEFLESVEIFVAAEKSEPRSGTASAVERAPLGSKPAITAVQSVEVTAVVESIDYATRMVKLRGPDGKIKRVKAGPAVKRLNEVKQGDTVVVRYTQATSITVTAPAK